MLIQDKLYGAFDLKEDVLLELLSSKAVQRLVGVSQRGYPQETKTSFHYYTRYDHSVGVMLILRKLNASLEEQVAGLLHDVSHTAFSHVIDWAIGDPYSENYQDSTLKSYIKNSDIPKILAKNDFDVERISDLEDNGNFKLLERKIPDLCADRLDYALRDSSYRFGINVDACVGSLIVQNEEIIFNSKDQAKFYATYYMRCQNEIWGSNENKLRYHLLGEALRIAIEEKIITMQDMYNSEESIIEKIRNSGNKTAVSHINSGLGKLSFVESENGDIQLRTKFRYVDPKFLIENRTYRLSNVDKDFKKLLSDSREKHGEPVRVKILQ